MRCLIIILGAGLLSTGLFATLGEADAAMPIRALHRSAGADSLVENVAYYYRRRYYGYRNYHRPYGYSYRRPYYGYGYHRPYYGRRWRY
jgi:hypothetical protein